MPRLARALTEDEGTFLSLLLRAQPTTAHTLVKIYEESPVSTYEVSKGTIYPMVRRLHAHGLIRKRRIRSDARGTELLECTKLGEKAVRAWLLAVKPPHLLLDDPLRTRVQAFGLLSREQQLEWVVAAKLAMQEKFAELEQYGEETTVPFKDIVHDNAVASLRARMDWLDRLLARVVRE